MVISDDERDRIVINYLESLRPADCELIDNDGYWLRTALYKGKEFHIFGHPDYYEKVRLATDLEKLAYQLIEKING